MQTTTQETQKHSLVSYKVLSLNGPASRARTKEGVRKAIANGDASAEFEAVIKRPDGTQTTVTATWCAVRYDYGEVYWNATDDTRAMDKEDSMWSCLIDAVSMYDTLTAAHYQRVEDKKPTKPAARR